MNELESQEATAHEVVDFAMQRGLDLSSLLHDFAFYNEGRFILLWRKEGGVHYNLQGTVASPPVRYKASVSAFSGGWHEAGSVEDLGQALDLLKAWLIEMKQVEELPQRYVRREGI